MRGLLSFVDYCCGLTFVVVRCGWLLFVFIVRCLLWAMYRCWLLVADWLLIDVCCCCVLMVGVGCLRCVVLVVLCVSLCVVRRV